MSDGQGKVNVIHIRTREPYEPGENGAPIDHDSAEMLEQVLGKVVTGEVAGVGFIAWNRNRAGFDFEIMLPPEGTPETEALKYIGALRVIEQQLLHVAEFGLPGDEEIEE